MNLEKLHEEIELLYLQKNLPAWYRLFDIDLLLVKETWSADYLHAHYAESLHITVGNFCIDIAQNYLTEAENIEITAFTQRKIDEGVL